MSVLRHKPAIAVMVEWYRYIQLNASTQRGDWQEPFIRTVILNLKELQTGKSGATFVSLIMSEEVSIKGRCTSNNMLHSFNVK